MQEINPGLRDRLDRGGLIDVKNAPSPYRTHKGREIAHAFLTEVARRLICDEHTCPAPQPDGETA
jgi:hypothetical protein